LVTGAKKPSAGIVVSPEHHGARAGAGEVGGAGGHGPAVGVSPGAMAAHLLYSPAVDYPKLASFAHVEGPVVIEAVVSRDGRVIEANVLSGHHFLRGAALKAVRNRQYRPYVVNGSAADVRTIITVNFSRHHQEESSAVDEAKAR
jgi:periplasmic protein TonB